MIKSFKTPAAWHAWLARHHTRHEGLWLRFFKKGSGRTAIGYAEALDEALCWGWIDGQVKRHDEVSWVQRFTPRRPRSAWSKRNQEHVARLEAEGRMRPPGLAQVEAAKRDGRWAGAYEPGSRMLPPDDFLRALRRHKGALAYFRSCRRAAVYVVCYRLQTAKKPETRARRFAALVEMFKERRAPFGPRAPRE